MKECIRTDNPLISIVLAVYEPNLEWLTLQLDSLNNQTYENIELIVLDDCSKKVRYEDICRCIQEHVTNIPYRIDRNERNSGSNQTFEKLTLLAKGDYIAYCDQDDIWKENKLTVLSGLIEESGAQLVCSDVTVIDDVGNQVANSITKVRRRHIFYVGENLQDKLLFKNFVIGCTMLIRAQTAKEAIPFITSMVHDHYLALVSASKGSIEVCPERLVFYRIHKENQTNVMTGVKTKEDYYRVRILPFLDRMEAISLRFSIKEAGRAKCWAEARLDYYNGKRGSFKKLWKLRDINVTTTVFELLMLKMPPPVFLFAVTLIRRGIL